MSKADGWVDCPQCNGSGEQEHECDEDVCCCLDPEPGECDACSGDGGWYEKVED